LVNKLINKLYFIQSKVDECIFFYGSIVYLLYTNDSIIARPNMEENIQVIKDIKSCNLNITILEDVKDFLGVNMTKTSNNHIHVS